MPNLQSISLHDHNHGQNFEAIEFKENYRSVKESCYYEIFFPNNILCEKSFDDDQYIYLYSLETRRGCRFLMSLKPMSSNILKNKINGISFIFILSLRCFKIYKFDVNGSLLTQVKLWKHFRLQGNKYNPKIYVFSNCAVKSPLKI